MCKILHNTLRIENFETANVILDSMQTGHSNAGCRKLRQTDMLSHKISSDPNVGKFDVESTYIIFKAVC